MPERTRPGAAARRRKRRRRIAVLVIAAVVAVTLVGGGVALAAGREDGEHYRTVTAALGSVTQRVDAVGTVSSAERRDAAFSVAGTVSKVDVSVGDAVEAGDALASLDPADLQGDVDDATSDLADANQQLSDDLDSQTSTSTTSDTTSATGASASSVAAAVSPAASTGTAVVSDAAYTTSTTSTTSTTTAAAKAAAKPTPSPSAGSSDVEDALAAVQDAQDALLAQYDKTTKQLTASGDAVDASTAACTAFLAVTTTSGAAATGDVLTITPGTAAAGSAVKVVASGAGADPVQVRLASSGDVLTEVTPEDGSFTVGVVLPSATGAGKDALQLTSEDGTAISSTALTVTAADDGSVADALTSCQAAIGDALDAATTVGESQTSLMSLAKELDTAVTALGKAVDAAGGSTTPTTPTTPGQPSGQPSSQPSGQPSSQPTAPSDHSSQPTAPSNGTAGTGSTGGTGTGTQSGGGSSQTTQAATAADVVADRAAIDLAEANLDIAKSKLALVDLTSPVAGTVAAVSIAKGDTVSASSTTAVITVLGADGYTVTTSVPLSSIDVVEVGQSADVTVRSTDETLAATVSSIGVLDVSTSSTPAYTVDLALDPTDVQLYDGSSAQVLIEVAGGAKVLTVPTSAVHVDGSATTVQVLEDGKVSSVTVQRGAVGAELTEITSGLEAGDEVVLADLTVSMDSGDGTSTGGLSGLGGTTTDTPAGGSFPAGEFQGGGSFGGNRG